MCSCRASPPHSSPVPPPALCTNSYDLTTLDATHNFSDNSTQLDITRKLEGDDTLKLTTYSGSKEASLTYKHDPFKVVLNVPSSADKVSGSVVFEKEYLW